MNSMSSFKDSKIEEEFATVGYVKLPVLSNSDVKELSEFYIESTPNHSFKGFYSTMYFKNKEYRKKVDLKIKAILKGFIQKTFKNHEILFANFLMKDLKGENAVELHDDWTYVNERKYTSINLWIPLVNMNENTGSLGVIPKSHILKKPIRYTPYEEPTYFSFLNELKKNLLFLYPKSGEGILYNGALLHSSEPNLSDTPRLAINMVIKPKEADSIHYYKKNHGLLKKYSTDISFYYDYQLNDKPSEKYFDSEIAYDDTCFGLNELNKGLNPFKKIKFLFH